MPTTDAVKRTLALFQSNGGVLRTGQALALGIHPRTLYALRDEGKLEKMARGLYRLADLVPLTEPDLVTVALRVPRAIICAISALAFHGLTNQIPHVVDLAIRPGDSTPRIEHPPIRVFRFGGRARELGVETYDIDDVAVRIYSLSKSVVDAFRLRNRIGKDVAIEALRAYHRHDAFDVNELLAYARICRVASVMRPYLEALL